MHVHREAGPTIIGNEVHILILEEMVVTLDIKLEPQPVAEKPTDPPGPPLRNSASPARFMPR